jgi:PAS domain S-box-containing protein
VAFIVAIAAVGLAIPAEAMLRNQFGVQVPAVPFFMAVLLAAWIGGLYPGLLATVLSILTLHFIVARPTWAAPSSTGDFTRIVLFALIGALVSLLMEASLRRRMEVWRHATDRTRAEARLELVLATIGDHLVAYDSQWRYTYVNDDGVKLLGKSRDELLGRNIWEVFPETVGNQYYQDVHRAAAEQRVVRSENYYQPWDRWFENYIYPSPDGVTVFSTDITERKQAEKEQQEAASRKDDFLAVLAHELRGPMAPLRNGLHILQRLVTNEPTAQRAVEMMDRQMRQLVRLVDDLLDISRITRGKLDLKCERLELTLALQSAIEACRPQLESQGHQLHFNAQAQDLWVQGDFARLSQVFSNLLSNAVKYSNPAGSIRIDVDREASQAVISIRDTGIGIPPDAIEKIFDMFVQVPAHVEYTAGGLGIGLALVKQLVALHGGSVSAQSEGIGSGSTFIVRLPLLEPALQTAQPAVAGATARVARRRVLVADDNTDAARSLAMLLEMDGHEVRIAEDGQAAVEQASAFRPQIIFMDIGMPNLNGLDAARQIRALPWGKDVRIIALTGWGQEVDRLRSQQAGIDHHLVKPVDGEMLGALLDEGDEVSG